MDKNTFSPMDSTISFEIRKLLNAFPEPIFVTDSRGDILFFNSMSSGYYKDGDNNISQIIPGLELNGKDSAVYETMIKHYNGSVRDVPVEIKVSKWEQNYLVKLIDISKFVKQTVVESEKISAEKKLKASEEIDRILFESTLDGIIILDEKGNITDVNNSMCKILMLPADKIIGTGLLNFTNDDMHHSALEFYKKMNEQAKFEGEFPLIRGDGSVVQLEWKSISNFRPGLNLCVARDISVKNEAQNKLIEEYNFRKAIEDTITSGIVILNMDRSIEYANPAFCRLTEFEKYELLGAKPPYPYWPEEEIDNIRKVLETTITGNAPAEGYEVTFKRKSGKRFFAQLMPTALIDAKGEQIGWLISITDISERKSAQDKLIEEYNFRKAIEDSIPQGILVTDKNMAITYVNLSFCRMVGYDRLELLDSKAPYIYWDKEDTDIVMESFSKVFKGNIPPNGIESIFVKKNCEKFNVLLYPKVIRDAQGEIEALLVSVTDITGKKKAEIALKESEERYRSTLDNMMEGCAILDYNWNYLYVNEANAKHAHMKREDMIGKNMLELIPGMEKSKFFKIYKRCMDERTVQKVEADFTFTDGSKNWYEAIAQPIPEGVFVLSADITERKLAEESLHKSEHILNLILENVHEGIIVADAITNKIIAISRWDLNNMAGNFTSTIMDIPIEQFYKIKDVRDIKTGERVKPGNLPISRALRGEFVHNEEWLLARPDDSNFIAAVNAIPVYNEDKSKIVNSIAIWTNISERKQAEEALIAGEERYRTTLDNMLEGCAIIDFNWTYLYANKIHAEHTHRKLDDIIGNNFLELIPGIKESVFYDGFIRCMQDRTPQHIENNITFPDGAAQWFDVYLEPVPEGVFVLSIDKTDQKQAEVALKESEERFSTAFIDNPTPLTIAHADNGIYIDANNAFLEYFKLKKNDVVGKTSSDLNLISAEERIKSMKILKETGRIDKLETKIMRDGEERYVLTSVKTIKLNGKPATIASFDDITDLKFTEIALKESNEKYRLKSEELETILDAIPSPVWISHDAEAKVITGNKISYEILHKTTGENISASTNENVLENILTQYVDGKLAKTSEDLPIQKCLASGKQITSVELEFRYVDGNSLTLLGNVIPLFNSNGNIRGCVSAFTDITEIKKAHQALKESEESYKTKSLELETLLDAIPAVVWIAHDPECKLMTGNKASYEFLQLAEGVNVSASTSEVLKARVIEQKINGVSVSADEMPMQQSVKTKKSYPAVEIEMIFDNGISRIVYGNAVPILDDKGNVKGSISAFIDVTDRKRMELELKLSQVMYREKSKELETILNTIPTPVWIAHDSKGKVITGNKASYLVLNVPEGENISATSEEPFINELVSHYIDGKKVEPEDLPMQRCLRTGETIADTEIEYRFSNGDIKYLMGNCVPFFDINNNVRGCISSFSDITGIKIAQKALIESEERYREKSEELETILETLPVPVWIAKDPYANFIVGNKTANEIMGLPEGGNASLSTNASVLTGLITQYMEGVEVKAEEMPIQKCLSTGKPIKSAEIEFRYPNGKNIFLIGNAVPVYDRNNNIRGCVSAFTDITDIKNYQKALKDNEDRLRFSMKSANAGSWEWNLITGEEKWSNEYYDLFGLNSEEVKPSFDNWINSIHPGDRNKVLIELNIAIEEKGADLNTEFRAYHSKKGIRWINAIGKASFNENGEAVKLAGISLDITERKMAERHLNIQYAIANALAEAQPLKDATYKVLEAICRELGWDLGIWWVIDKERNLLKVESIWKTENISDNDKGITDPDAVFAPGLGLPGTVWVEDNPKWVSDIMSDSNFPRKIMASEHDLHAALAFPTRSGEEVTGIIECFSREVLTPNNDLLELFNAAGRQIGNFVERKRAEAKYIDLYENAPDMYVSFDPVTAIITQCNRTLASATAYSKDEMIGKSIFSIFHIDCRRELNRVRKEFEEKGEVKNAGLQLRTKAGQKIDVILNASAVRDEDGNIIYSRSSLRDITESKKYEFEIKQRDIELTDFIEKAPVGLSRLAKDGTIIWSNNTEIKNLGYKKDEFISHNIKEFLLDKAAWQLILKRLHKYEQIKNLDLQFKDKNGEIKYLLLSANTYKENGKILYIKTFTRDITPRKIAESHLNIQYSISKELARTRTLKYAAEKAMEAICTGIGWKAALWWQIDEKEDVIKNYTSWHSKSLKNPDADIFSIEHKFKKGEALPGRVWKSEKPLYIENIFKDKSFKRLDKIAAMGLGSAFAFPVKVSGKVISIVEGFGERVVLPSRNLIEMLESTGKQINNFIERIKAEDALKNANETLEDRVRERTAQLKNVIDKLEHEIEEREKAEKEIEILAQAMKSTNDSVCITDLKNKILFINSAFERTYGYTEDEVMGKSAEIVRSRKLGIEQLKQIDEETLNGGWQGEIINIRKDGSEFPVWLSTSVINDNFGKPRALISVTNDITESKKNQMLLQQQAEFVKLLQEITVAANQTFDINEVLKLAVEKICSFMKWEVGHVYKVTKGKEFESAKIWHFSNMRKFNTFRNITERLRIKKDKGIPGLIFRKKRPVWISNVTKSAYFVRKHSSLDVKVRSAIAFPVLVKNEVVRILEFYTTKIQKPNKQILDIMLNIGTQLGRVVERRRALESISDSETKFKAVAETANDAIISVDSNYNIIYFNKSAETIFGFKEEELVSKSFLNIFAKQYRQILKQSLEDIINKGKSELSGNTVEFIGLKKNNIEFPIEFSISDWKSSDGIYFTAMIRDITKRKEGASKLLKSEKLLRDAQHIAHIGSFEWDIPKNKVYWSEELYQIYGLKYDEFDGSFEGFLTCIDPQDRENVQQVIIQSYQNAVPFSIEERIIRPGGEIRTLQTRGEFIKDDKGKVTRLLGTCQDITERKESEEQLRRSEKGLKDSQKIAHLGSWEWDLKTNIVTYSDEFLRIYEQDPNNFDPKNFKTEKFIHPDDRGWASKLAQTLINSQKPFSVHYRIILPDSTIKILRGEGQVEKDINGNPIKMYGSVLDVTEQKLIEEELRQTNEKLRLAQNELIHSEKLAALGRFSSGIAHEIRNPLANISALAQILMSKYNVDPKMKKHLRYILINTDIANRIIKDLLNFASPDEAPFKHGNVEKIINNLYNIVKTRCVKNKVHLIKQISPNLPNILLNEKKLQAAFLNFISNAIDAMPKGGKLRIDAALDKRANDIIITFEDTGGGISPEYMDKIFEPFFTTKDEGTGLGLSLAYQVIKSHEGKLEIQSRVGHGTKIEVKIPVK